MKKIITFLSVLLVAALLLGMVPFGAFRTEAYAATTTQTANDPNVEGSKKIDKDKDTKALDPDHRDVDITLSLPSAEYKNVIDIVFTMDSSSSAQNSKVFSESVNDLFNSILTNNPGVELKVGVIRFRGRAHDAIAFKSDNQYKELVPYNDDTKEYIDAALNMTEKEIKDNFGNGSNTHGGMDIADEWLSADKDVPDNHKYVVLLTDGKTYIWNNEKNEPQCIYMQQYNNGANGRWTIVGGGVPQFGQSISTYKDSYPEDVLDPTNKSNIFWFKNYQDLYDCKSEELSGVSPWDAFCYYADTKTAVPTGTVKEHYVTNAAIQLGLKGDFQTYFEFTPDPKWEDVPYLESHPYVVYEENGSYFYDEDTINPNYYMYHVDGLMKSMYLSGHLWTKMNSKYNCGVITYSGGGATGFVSLRNSFVKWLQDNSAYGADITNSAQVESLFEGIDNDIRYMVASGIVTDPIPEQFELKATDGTCPFTLETEADGELDPVQIDDNSWGFGLLEESADGTTASTYKYVVAYVDNSIEWTINVPVENANKVTLTYTLTIKEDTPAYNEKTGELIEYPTNGDTILNYVSTDGSRGEYEFNVPSVTYAEKHLIRYHSNYPGVEDNAQLVEDDTAIKLPYDIKTSDQVEFSTDGKWTGPDGKEWEFDYWETIDGERYDVPGQYPKAEGEVVPGDDPNGDQNPDEVTPAEGQDNTQTPNDSTTNDPTTGEAVPASGGSSRMTLVAIASSSAENGVEEPAEEEAEPELELYAQWKNASPSGGGGTPTGTTRYTVTYQYTGDVPSGAPSVPASKTYAVGASVPAASVPSMEGYTFSGWSGEVSTMPNHDVTVTGSWTADEPIDDPDTPLAPPTDGDTEIDDPDTPLAPGTVDEETEINDEETPLTPFTGDARHTGVWAGISLAALLGIILLGKKRKVNE